MFFPINTHMTPFSSKLFARESSPNQNTKI
ncbi:hypothetical protein MXB_865 [Myxobolus squamalis]|nr:hypothetical protein MXB_865 [Myxobolus squamalis]